MDKFQKIAEDATNKISKLLTNELSSEQHVEVANVVERAVIQAVLESQHRAVDAALHCPEADQDIAHKIATAIRQKNDALIVNLSSQR